MATKRKAKKTAYRLELIEDIVDALTDKKMYKKLNLDTASEGRIAQNMYFYLRDKMEDFFRKENPKLRTTTVERKANRSVLWEGDASVVIHNIQFLGTQHRPDFLIQLGDLDIGIELKKGDSGASIREGLGQSLVYAHEYEFVIYIFVDTSPNKKIQKSLKGENERMFLESLWQIYNIKFEVV